MKVIGLTGGTGSGKSTAARRFADRGIPVIDADVIGHELIAPGGAAEAAVIERFGDAALTCGTIDRAKLGAIVFADPQALAALNAIVHPLLAAEIAARCAAHASAGARACVIDAALLGEGAALEPWLDGLVLVAAPVETRVHRLRVHRGMDEAAARARIGAQVDPERKRALARWVIQNDGSLAELYERVDAVIAELPPPDRSTWND